ncbi:dCTP pyrophosphatase 1-like [Homarus americanus]|uniref:dCTP pyrophosphatase 1 n=1 Tax=Homarus americanus TaxID=6706 RepID=A0A8J5JN19_HOMAM|nr:dCTP pyrophosphatase 1-like [Homarus americanus]KAG7161357.1 dCTP pyrophosphatase 1-like [Homarus americanus]
MTQSAVNGTSSINSVEDEFRFSTDLSLEDIRSDQHKFCEERNWLQHHPPRNVLLAMVGEVGELSELFQWRGEVTRGLPEFTSPEKVRVGEELSDVLIYLVDLAEQCHIDLPTAVRDKMKKNALKYPVQRVSGKTDKYSSYPESKQETSDVGDIQREREEADGSE